MTVDFNKQVEISKTAFNEYADAKNKYSHEFETKGALLRQAEIAMKDKLSAWLRTVLDCGRELWKLTDTDAERKVLVDFGAEINRIYKG